MKTRAQPLQSRLGRLLFLALALSSLALACKGSDDKPAQPPAASGAGGAPDGGPGEQPPGGEAGTNAQGGAGAGRAPLGDAGELNLPGAGGAPTEPGSWDESFWDNAVWQ